MNEIIEELGIRTFGNVIATCEHHNPLRVLTIEIILELDKCFF